MASLSGKVITVTGAASGIGLATAKLLALRGALLSIADINSDGLQKALDSLAPNASGEKHIATVVDVASAFAVNSWIKSTLDTFGRLDGAANIAGVSREHFNILRNSLDDDWDFVMGVNGKGTYNCMRAQLNAIVAPGGSIVNTASPASFVGGRTTPAYVASKHAVVGLTKAAAREEGERGVRVNCVEPGTIATSMIDTVPEEIKNMLTKRQCFDRTGDPAEVAEVFAFLLSDAASFVTGCCYQVDGGFLA